MDLTGRKVLITGANRGVGAAFVAAALSGGAAT
jgi:NAD(P)-dependent dehydrogenase (short-subunit alcohol dehydrogenase family)